MKRNSSYAKIILAAIFFQSNLAIGAENYTQQTNSEANKTEELQPLVCDKVPSPNWNEMMGGERPMIDDPVCTRENQRRASARAYLNQTQGQASRVSTGDGTTLVAPKAPVFNCTGDVYSAEYISCQNSHNAAMAQYQKDLAVYNNAQTLKGEAQKADELKAIEDQKNKTAAATLAEIKDKNDKGKKSFDATAAITMGLGIAAVVKGTACASSCPTGCCGAAPGYFALGAAFFLLNSKAKKQSSEHAASSASACNSLNQISSTQTDCNTQSNPGSTETITINPETGKCTPEGSDLCKQAAGGTAAPPDVRDALRTSGFASGKGIGDQWSLQPDGSIKFKNGKTFKEGDFKDINSLMGAGLSAGAAKSVFDALSASQGGLAGTGLDLKNAKKDLKEGGVGGSYGADGSTTVVDSGKAQTSDKKFSDDLGAKKDDKKFGEERAPSSEGLAKEFNGELIGVAGDDIFLMMNRRYKLKSEQDSFIAADTK